MPVDQGAGATSCARSRRRAAAGVPEDRWVFPLAGADANDHWFLSDRPELHRSPAIRLAGRRALELAGVGIDDVGPVDLYSCFPCRGPDRPPTSSGCRSTTRPGPSP